MKPVLTELSTGYLIEWDDQVRARTGAMRLRNDGSTSAEVSIEANFGGKWQHIKKPAIINLSSDQTRMRLAKDCQTRYGSDDIDWYAVIEQLADTATTRFKEGEEVVELASGADVKPPEHIIEPFIVKNYPNVIFGDPGSFKSNFVLALCMLAGISYHDNALNIPVPDEPLKILWLDWETDRETVNWTMTRLQNGIDNNAFFLHYRKCLYPLKQDVEQVKRTIDKVGADMIVIDSLGLASGGEPKETEPALSFFQALRQLKVTSLIIGHNSKNKEEKSKSIYGNMYYTALARNIWEVRKVAEPGDEEIDIALFHRKAPPFSRLQKAFGYKISFEPDRIDIKAQEATTVREFVDQMGTPARIENLLLDGAMTKSEIVASLGISDSTCRQALKRLRDKNRAVQLTGEKWGLKYHD